jgi:hypothetical protein
MFICGGDDPSPRRDRELRVRLTPFVCPWCRGTGRWESGERCSNCAEGLTDDPTAGVDLATSYPVGVEPPELAPAVLPRPPAVMKSSCSDCAFRPGSPEDLGVDGMGQVSLDRPFYCHHGMATKTADPVDYAVAAWIAGMPLGYFVCAGWWQVCVEDQAPPSEPYRALRAAPHAEPQPVRRRGWAPCVEGLGRERELDGGCPWCSRDIAQRRNGQLFYHHNHDGDPCAGVGRVPVPRVVTVELAGAVP